VKIVIPLPLALTLPLPGCDCAAGEFVELVDPLGASPPPPEEAMPAAGSANAAISASDMATNAMARRLTIRFVPSYRLSAYEVS
jgi:hypothetical protein